MLKNYNSEIDKKIAENKEISDLKKILGLESGRVYNTIDDVHKNLRYGKIMFMTDQDLDGSHIKGTERLGFGSVYVYNNKEYYLTGTELSDDVANLKEKFDDIAFSNPTMEMLALAVTLESFSNTGEHIVINQDYTGAVNYDGLWQYSEGSNQRADKPWNAKEKYIKYLVARAKAAIEKIQNNGGSVKILWVKGHAGNTMNELADKYAKQRSNENTLTSPLIPADSNQNNVSLNPEISSEGEEEQDNDGINGGEEGYSPFAEGTNDMPPDPYEGLTPSYNPEDEDINNDIDPDDFECKINNK